jgi:uncharacterized protein Veg
MRHFRLAALLVFAAAVLAPSLAAAFHNGEVVLDGFRLPKDHRFESPDAKGKYLVVDINQVPSLIRQGRFVFDRTGNAWIARPGGGLNMTYLASNATSSTSAAGSSSTSSGWANLHGQVQSVSGSSITFKADDGRQLTVDASKIGQEIRNSLQPGTAATVAGYQWTGPNALTAEFIQKDTAGAAAPAPSASPTTSGPVDTSNWQKIHGQVQSVNGSQMTLKADDGRTVNVDMKDVGAAIQKSMTQGTPVTVTGFYTGGQNNVAAKYIQKDSSAK